MKKQIFLKAALAGLLILTAGITSCEIGLGEAVDTEAPTISITYPPDSAIIREAFVLAGTVGDDQGINTVKVTITNTDTYAKYTYDAAVSGNSWSLQLNGSGAYNGFAFADGRYTADVYAKDNAERVSGTASRSFDIDNTAPVLILSKPNSFNGNTPSTFGRVLKLAGDISEDHTVESLVLHYQQYDTATSSFLGEERKISVSNVTEMSADSPLIIARYYTPDETGSNSSKSDLRNKYLEVYGSSNITETRDDATGKYSFTSSGDQKYYCALELTDNARVYNNPGDSGSGHGNITSVYYVNDVNNTFKNSLMTDSSYGLTADKLKRLLNGTGSDYNDSQKAAIRGILTSNVGLTQSSSTITTESSVFNLDPDNSPYYEIGGYELGTEYKKLSSGSNLNLTVTAGKDSVLVKPSSVTVKLQEMKKLDGTNTYIVNESVKPFYLIDAAGVKASKWDESDSEIIRKQMTVENSLVNEDGKGISQNALYKIEIECSDREGNEAVSSNADGYGFTLNSSSNPPTLTILTEQDKTYSGTKIASEGLEVEFSVVTDSVAFLNASNGQTYNSNINIYKSRASGTGDGTVNVVNSSSGNTIPGDVTVAVTKPNNVESDSSGNTYNFKLKIGGTSASVSATTGKYKYSFYIVVTDSANLTATSLFTFYVDNQPPVVSKVEVSKPVSSGTEKLLNGNVQVTAAASDNDELKDVRYWVYAYDPNKDTETLVTGGTDGISSGARDPDFTVNTNLPEFDSYIESGVTYYKNLRVKFIAEDKVGNKCSPVYAYYKKTGDTGNYEYTVNQTSDTPVISGGNINQIASENLLDSSSGNVFDSSSKIIGLISDDDGLSAADITFYTDSTKKTKVTMPSGTSNPRDLTSYSGTTFNDVVLPAAGGTYYVVINAKDSKFGEAAADATVNGVLDSDRKSKIEGYRTQTYETWIAIDNNIPQITETKVNTEETQYVKNDDAATENVNEALISFAGTVSDAGDWKLASSPLTVTLNGAAAENITPNASTGAWTYSKDMTSEADGDYEFVFELTDQSGKTNTVTRSYVKDKTAPVFGSGTSDTTASGYNAASVKPYIITEGITTGDATWYKVTTLQISGTVADGSGSGIASVEYSTDGNKWVSLDTSTESVTNAGTTTRYVKYNGTITNLTHGTTISLRAADKAGNSSSASLGPVQIDLVVPEGESKKFASAASEVTPADGDYSDVSGTVIANGTKDIYVTGTANDSLSGVKSILLMCGSNDFTSPDVTITTFTADATVEKPNQISWSGRLGADKIRMALASASTGSLWARITDKAGNSTDIPLFVIMYDGQYPEAKITDVKYKGTENTVTKANKKITIKGTAKDNQNLKSVKLEYIKKSVYDADTSSAWTQYGTAITTDPYNWSFDVDTTEKDSSYNLIFEDGQTYYFRVSATDEATNTGNSFNQLKVNGVDQAAYLTTSDSSGAYMKAITIDQDSDRPTITLTTLTCGASMSEAVENHAHLYNINKLYFSASDDDGVGKLEIRYGYSWTNTRTESGESKTYTYYTKAAVPAATDKLYTDAGCLTDSGKTVASYTASSGVLKITGEDYEYKDSDASWTDITSVDNVTISPDGPYIIAFRLTDASEANTVFTSGAAGTKGPVLIDASGNRYEGNTQLYVDVDMEGPSSQNLNFASFDGTSYGTPSESESSQNFGGKYKNFKILVDLKDANGVKSVTLTHPDTTKNQTITDSTGSKRDGNWHNWVISDIDVSGLPTGVNSFGLTVEDYAGNKDESTFNITVDNSAPELTVENYDENTLLGTAFVLKGTVRGYDSGTDVKFFTSSESTVTAAHANWSDSTKYTVLQGEIASWRINVDGNVNKEDGETHTKNHKQLFVAAYGTTEDIYYDADQALVLKTSDNSRYTTVKPLYFHFLTTDKVGNKSVKTFCIRIDPQGDIPTVTLTYPTNGLTQALTGKIRAQGTASVKGNNTIVGVYMQIDPTFDTSFDANKDWTQKSLADAQAAVKCPDGTTTLNSRLPSDHKIEYIYERYNALDGVTKKLEDSTSKKNIYAIYVGNTASWNYTLNESDELNGAGNSNSTIGIRMYIVDSAGGINEVDTNDDVSFQIDSNAPKIASSNQLYLYQYAWTTSSTTATVKTYYTNEGTAATSTGSIVNGKTVNVYTAAGCNDSEKASVTGTYSGTNDSITVSGVEYKKNWSSVVYDEMNANWLKGEWWLTGSVEDDSGISLIKDTKKSYQLYPVVTGNTASNVTAKTWGTRSTETSGFIFNYRVGSTAANQAGSIDYCLYVEDGSASKNSGNKDISINYDNKPPVFNTSDGNLKISHKINNSNGFYTLSSTAYETGTQSGFARTVFYFTRSSNGKIFDPYIKKGSEGNAQTYSSLRSSAGLYWKTNTVTAIDGKNITITSADANIHKGGLVELGGTYYKITARVSTTKYTLDKEPASTLVNSPVYFAIGQVVDTVGSESTGTNTYTTAEGYGYYSDSADNDDDFMIESVITTNGMSKWTGSINSNNISDGPIVVHYVAFDAAGNYAEGSVTGTDVKVENNPPRLASVRVWCDYNGNGTENADEESRTFYYNGSSRRVQVNNVYTDVTRATDITDSLVVSGNKLGIPTADSEKNSSTTVSSGTAYMTVKNKVTFFPEIIGGNNNLYYQFMCGSNDKFISAYSSTNDEFSYSSFSPADSTLKGQSATAAQAAAGTNNFGIGHDDGIDESADSSGYYKTDFYSQKYMEGHTGYGTNDGTAYKMEVTTAMLEKLGNNTSSLDPTWFEYIIWDSTEGTTVFTDSLKATMQIALNVQYTDTTAPVVNVNRFFYDQAGCDEDGIPLNSLYKGSSDNGHIELEGQLSGINAGTTTLQGTDTTNKLVLNETDPKVSGKITIRGTAYDDIRLSTLYVKFPGHSKAIGSALTAAATYNNGTWTSASADTAANMTANGWTFTATDQYNNEDGHLVNWEFNVDTSFITNKAAQGVAFQFQAKDERGVNSDNTKGKVSSTSDILTDSSVSKYNRPGYTMDVVPYITKVETKLSEYDTDNPDVYARTALGHYPVYMTTAGFSGAGATTEGTASWSTDTVKIYGFNFDKDDGKDYVTYTVAETAGTKTISSSGDFTIYQNKIPTLNNINVNDAKGDVTTLTQDNYSTYAYNRRPNGVNNNLLTDDVNFDIWQFNSAAVLPIAGKADNPVMKINPASGLIGFAFTNGSERFSMPGTLNGTDYSYYWWNMSYDYLKWNALAYDSTGHTYACTVGGDINGTSSTADNFTFMTDRLTKVGTPVASTNNTGGSYLRVDTIGQLQSDNTYVRDKNRFQSQSIATIKKNDTSTNVYMAYYDKINDEIRFKAGRIYDNTTEKQFGTFTDIGGNTAQSYATTRDACQVIASGTAASTTSLGKAGQYLAIDVTQNAKTIDTSSIAKNTVVLVWFDGTDLKYSYNKNPMDGINVSSSGTNSGFSNAAATKGVSRSGWNDAVTILSNAGKYCKMVIDNDDGVHIAAYDEQNSSLRYVYIKDITKPENAVTATVDSYLDAGENLTIDVAKSGDYQIPSIGYWGGFNEKPRYAYLADPESFYASTNAKTDGADSNDMYTGIWECSVVPTISEATQNTINVGLWKNAASGTAGNLAYSTTGTSRGTASGTNSYKNSRTRTYYGYVYGNGTNNAVLGYAINIDGSTRYLETAQKK